MIAHGYRQIAFLQRLAQAQVALLAALSLLHNTYSILHTILLALALSSKQLPLNIGIQKLGSPAKGAKPAGFGNRDWEPLINNKQFRTPALQTNELHRGNSLNLGLFCEDRLIGWARINSDKWQFLLTMRMPEPRNG